MPKVAVYTMARDERDEVEAWCQSTHDADYRLVLDTGSKDGTAENLALHGVHVCHGRIEPWRFDVARNTALALLPPWIDVCVKLDMDERLSPGWYEAIQRSMLPGITRLSYRYTWDRHPDGSPRVQFDNDLIHARRGYVWRHPTHEALYAYFTGEKTAPVGLTIDHFQKKRPRPNDLALLALAVAENRCPRSLFYFGRELYFHGQFAVAVPILCEYISHKESMFAGEKAQALSFLHDCYFILKSRGALKTDDRVAPLDHVRSEIVARNVQPQATPNGQLTL
jgi:glycosyltransferase involved in cell wall biosynthesis